MIEIQWIDLYAKPCYLAPRNSYMACFGQSIEEQQCFNPLFFSSWKKNILSKNTTKASENIHDMTTTKVVNGRGTTKLENQEKRGIFRLVDLKGLLYYKAGSIYIFNIPRPPLAWPAFPSSKEKFLPIAY